MEFMDAFVHIAGVHIAGQETIFARGMAPAPMAAAFRSAFLLERSPGLRKKGAERKDLGKITAGCQAS
ncbi:MAG: hypothetical protein ACREDD_03340 [Methylocella sp.]